MFIKILLIVLFATPCMAEVVADTMPWKNDPHVLIALEKPRMHYQIQKKEPNIVIGDVQVSTCVEYNGGECKPSTAFYSIITSEDL